MSCLWLFVQIESIQTATVSKWFSTILTQRPPIFKLYYNCTSIYILNVFLHEILLCIIPHINIIVFVFQAQMVYCMLSRVPAERPEASEITEAPLFQELEVPCRIRQRTRTYSASSAGRPTRQISSSN